MSIRLRLTLQYSGALFAAGLVQLAVLQALVEHSESVMRNFFGSHRELLRNRLDDLLEHFPVREEFRAGRLPERFAFVEETRDGIQQELLILSFIAVIVVGAVALLLGWWLAGRALAPIHQISALAGKISAGTLSQRIELAGPNDELRELADTFDAMLDRLQASFDSQRRFIANASHELRTPMAIERSIVEVELANPDASDDLVRVGEQFLAVQKRSERLIDGLLTLAHSEEQVQMQSLDLAEVTNSGLAMMQPLVDASNLRVSCDLKVTEVLGNPTLLDRLVLNLIKNAVEYNEPDGWIQIRVFPIANQDGNGEGVLTVENPGAVVDPADLAGLFEPFTRGQDRIGPGVGLGLSIAHAVAMAHGGSLQAEARPEGGLYLTATIPFSAQQA